MSKATDKNEIQVVLQEYLGNRRAAKVAEAVYKVMQTENGKKFFINEDSNGATMESMVEEHVKAILSRNLEEDDVQECLEQLMAESISIETEMTAAIETITVEGSDSQIYKEMLKYTSTNKAVKKFMKFLKEAVNAGCKSFKVPVCDPSIDKNGSLQFIAGCKPVVGYSDTELKELAIKNGVQLGSKNQYVLFLATIIHRLVVEEGWSMRRAFYVVCIDSTEIGHYCDSKNAKHAFEVTGSRKIGGKGDLGNTCKILAKDEKTGAFWRNGGFWIAGGDYNNEGYCVPIANLELRNSYVLRCANSVGWFVIM